jgi:hypothetical protein
MIDLDKEELNEWKLNDNTQSGRAKPRKRGACSKKRGVLTYGGDFHLLLECMGWENAL